jgi:hypothetical protein
VSDLRYISILSHNNDPQVVLRMTDLHGLDALPLLRCADASNFAKAIDLLRQTIDEDVAYLRSAGRTVLRPLAFMLTAS